MTRNNTNEFTEGVLLCNLLTERPSFLANDGIPSLPKSTQSQKKHAGKEH